VMEYYEYSGAAVAQHRWSSAQQAQEIIPQTRLVPPGGLPSTGTTLQAEDATIDGPAVSTAYAGYTGTGFVDYLDSSGDYIEWTHHAPEAGTYTIEVRYANGSSSNDRPLELRVNGSVVNSRLSFPPTGAWANWTVVQANVPLVAGANTIRLTTVGSSGANIDALTVR
jgi:hypothetical protein